MYDNLLWKRKSQRKGHQVSQIRLNLYLRRNIYISFNNWCLHKLKTSLHASYDVNSPQISLCWIDDKRYCLWRMIPFAERYSPHLYCLLNRSHFSWNWYSSAVGLTLKLSNISAISFMNQKYLSFYRWPDKIKGQVILSQLLKDHEMLQTWLRPISTRQKYSENSLDYFIA